MVSATPGERDEHLRLERAFIECPGMWVAIDRQTGEVRATASSPYELAGRIKSELIRGLMFSVPRLPANLRLLVSDSCVDLAPGRLCLGATHSNSTSLVSGRFFARS